jgi:hypothetical protein
LSETLARAIARSSVSAMANATDPTPQRPAAFAVTGPSSRTSQEPELTAWHTGLTHRFIQEQLVQEPAAPVAAPTFARRPLGGATARPSRATAWFPDPITGSPPSS